MNRWHLQQIFFYLFRLWVYGEDDALKLISGAKTSFYSSSSWIIYFSASHLGREKKRIKMALKSTFGLAVVNHNYTEEERQVLNSYQSLEYMPPHSKVYRNWLQQQPARLDWDRWLMMGLIGFSVGLLGFLLHQIIDLISELKWEHTIEYIKNGDFTTAWLWTFSYSFIFLVISSLLVIYQPSAAGSGIPEIIGFLNGTRIKDIFKVQTLIVKFLSCAFAVGCGMPVGYEGPMIHLGSLVAAGMSQFKSATFECSLPCFSR